MARVISDECVSCGTCEAECPVGAIAEGDGKYVIDADACIDCGACEGARQKAASWNNRIFYKKEVPWKSIFRELFYFITISSSPYSSAASAASSAVFTNVSAA